MKAIRLCWVLAATLLLISGLMHLYSIFFTLDLYPVDEELTKRMKDATVHMGYGLNIWNMWVGFHAMFSVLLIFMASGNMYLCLKHFAFLRRRHFILISTIVINAFVVWVGIKYLFPGFVLAMSLPLLLFVISYMLILATNNNSQI